MRREAVECEKLLKKEARCAGEEVIYVERVTSFMFEFTSILALSTGLVSRIILIKSALGITFW